MRVPFDFQIPRDNSLVFLDIHWSKEGENHLIVQLGREMIIQNKLSHVIHRVNEAVRWLAVVEVEMKPNKTKS
jgi:hypothetical protein